MNEIQCVQGSPEWRKLRIGIPTGSEFGRIVKPNLSDIEVLLEDAVTLIQSARPEWEGVPLSPGQVKQLAKDVDGATKARKYARFRGYTDSSSQDAYAAELVAESLGWYKSEFKGSPDTERGNRLEKEALRWLRLHHGIKTRPVGFLLSDCGRYGCSPDAIAEDGCPVEVKAPDLHTFIKWHIAGGLPDDHKAQCHGEIILADAPRCYFVAYPDNQYVEPKLIVVERDEFTAKLKAALPVFCDRLDKLRRELTGDEYEVLFRTPTAETP